MSPVFCDSPPIDLVHFCAHVTGDDFGSWLAFKEAGHEGFTKLEVAQAGNKYQVGRVGGFAAKAGLRPVADFLGDLPSAQGRDFGQEFHAKSVVEDGAGDIDAVGNKVLVLHLGGNPGNALGGHVEFARNGGGGFAGIAS